MLCFMLCYVLCQPSLSSVLSLLVGIEPNPGPCGCPKSKFRLHKASGISFCWTCTPIDGIEQLESLKKLGVGQPVACIWRRNCWTANDVAFWEGQITSISEDAGEVLWFVRRSKGVYVEVEIKYPSSVQGVEIMYLGPRNTISTPSTQEGTRPSKKSPSPQRLTHQRQSSPIQRRPSKPQASPKYTPSPQRRQAGLSQRQTSPIQQHVSPIQRQMFPQRRQNTPSPQQQTGEPNSTAG